MHRTVHTPARRSTAWPAGRLRLWSLACAVLLVPAVAVFSLTRAGDCLAYGEGCPTPIPDLHLQVPLAVAGTAFLTALLLPDRPRHAPAIRRAAFAAQIAAEAAVLLVVLLPR